MLRNCTILGIHSYPFLADYCSYESYAISVEYVHKYVLQILYTCIFHYGYKKNNFLTG
jgi:hypothetical protein